MTFNIITIFPDIFYSYFKESIIKRALKNGLIKINIHNLRDWTEDSHKTVDDKPYGGGIGMVLKVEPIYKTVQFLKKERQKSKNKIQGQARYGAGKKTKVILFTPRGKKFNQRMAYQFSQLDQLIFICGRYEGVDERVAKHIADVELSIGDYVLMGGELPAMIIVEAVARLIPGVLGKPSLLKERISKEKGFIEFQQYTRPEIFSPKKRVKWRVPKVLLSGDHKKIEEWRRKHKKIIASRS
ncbi:tRNA (guanosine(37)-N1)-methyltransferase TrmD [Patescibacteria group bacterium]|nr:tRNA (guanosine(37)-N1)-methyltransferase TrmD [Patescibacteria group bacterium]